MKNLLLVISKLLYEDNQGLVLFFIIVIIGITVIALIKKFTNDYSSHKNEPTKEVSIQYNKQTGNPIWITVGFLLSFMGGAIGVIMGMNYSKRKYNTTTRVLGWIMMIIGAFMITIFKQSMGIR